MFACRNLPVSRTKGPNFFGLTSSKNVHHPVLRACTCTPHVVELEENAYANYTNCEVRPRISARAACCYVLRSPGILMCRDSKCAISTKCELHNLCVGRLRLNFCARVWGVMSDSSFLSLFKSFFFFFGRFLPYRPPRLGSKLITTFHSP